MAIKIQGLTLQYSASETLALNNLDLEIGKGMFGLLGPNGAGKTTLMKILATLLKPTEGTIMVEDIELLATPHKIREILGYLPQDYGVYKRITPVEFLTMVADMKGISRKQVKYAVADVLEQVNLTNVAKKPAGTFSGGMRQRLGIAQALLGNPRIMIVDEPTAGLDPEERVRFRNLLASISLDRTVILSTHIVADIESTCSDLAILGKGKIVFKGSPEELIQRAKGRVWQYNTTELGLAALQKQYKIISTRRVNGEVVLRFVAQDPGFGQAVQPALEDAYMAVMGKEQSNGTGQGLY